MRVHHLSCGSFCPRGGGWLDGRSGGFFSKAELVCHVLLIETDHAGLVLVDTGFGTADIARPTERLGRLFPLAASPILDRAETAIAQVEALGFDAADVRHIIPTHMDLDHVGGLSDFPQAVVHVMKKEHYAATEHPTAAESSRYRAAQLAHDPRYTVYEPTGEPWNGFDAVRALEGLPPELLLVPLEGHSRGHAAVVVETGANTLIHAGDAYFHENEMTQDRVCPPGLRLFQNLLAFDKKAMLENKARLRELVLEHADTLTVFSAHDGAELRRMQAGG
ncbi:MAG: MBL fold metallo-hydrolase [Sandaracinaceae bacterium]